jgi:SAM-dependent methyltransferase
VAAAYSATGGAWQVGPGRIYDRLAEVLVDRCPGGVAGRAVLDLGAGTGAASRAALAAGARSVVALDVAPGMLAHDAGRRPPGLVGDSVALPVRSGSFGAVVAAFSLNHLDDPAAGLAEAARVLVPGGGLIASAYATDDTHPVRAAVEAACAERGWEPEPWYLALKADAAPRLATIESAAAAAAVLPGATVGELRVPFPDLAPADLVAWRLGMAQLAGFVAGLAPPERAAVEADARARLGPGSPVLVRSCITIAWRRPG